MSESPDLYRDRIARVVKVLRDARSLLILTGAGISAESGLPTYRGVGGLYAVEHPVEGVPIEEILSGSMLARNPRLTWKYLLQIAEACQGVTFNRAHAILAEWERRYPRVWVVTQNVDGLHRAAGSHQLIELHGDLHELICPACGNRERPRDLPRVVPPPCPACGQPLRPDVVLFGELLPPEKIERLQRELEQGFDVVFSIGTSAVFPYIAGPIHLARLRGIPTIEINPTDSEVSELVQIRLPLPATVALEAIEKGLQEQAET